MGHLRHAVPSVVTLVGLTVGLGAMRLAMSGQTEEAAWFILYAMLLDQLDGALARLLNARSRIGAELDSFSDFVAFGLAPAFLVVGVGSTSGGDASRWLERGLAALYVYGCVLRLAIYNAHDAGGSRVFHGLPSTLAGSVVAAAVLTAAAHGVLLTGLPLAAGLAALGILMVTSALRPPKVHVLLARAVGRGRLWSSFAIGNVVAVYAVVIWRVAPEYILCLALTYGSIGSFLGRTPPWRDTGLRG